MAILVDVPMEMAVVVWGVMAVVNVVMAVMVVMVDKMVRTWGMPDIRVDDRVVMAVPMDKTWEQMVIRVGVQEVMAVMEAVRVNSIIMAKATQQAVQEDKTGKMVNRVVKIIKMGKAILQADQVRVKTIKMVKVIAEDVLAMATVTAMAMARAAILL